MVTITDIETLKNCFTLSSITVNSSPSQTSLEAFKQQIYQYQVSEYLDQRSTLRSHLMSLQGMIGFNSLTFDAQVLQYFLNNYDSWGNLSGLQVAQELYKFAQKCIELSNENKFSPYPEWKLWTKQLDLFLLWHFNNKAKMVSLKYLSFMLDEDVEEMGVKHYENIREDQIKDLYHYNLQDCRTTEKLYNITKGNTDHPLYKQVDKIQLRKDIQKEFGLKCMNFNDVKIGDQLNKLNYMKIKQIQKSEIPTPNKEIPEFTFGDCYPEYTKFETAEFNNFIQGLKNIKVKLK